MLTTTTRVDASAASKVTVPDAQITTVAFSLNSYNTSIELLPSVAFKTATPLIHDNLIKLDDIMQESVKAGKEYTDEQSVLIAQIQELKTKLNSTSYWHITWPWQSLGDTITWCERGVVFLIVLYIICSCSNRPRRAMAGYVGAGLPLKGFAEPLSSITLVTNLATTDTAMNITGGENSTQYYPINTTGISYTLNATKLHMEKFIEAAVDADYHLMLLTIIILTIITLMCTSRMIQAEHRQILARLGCFARNENTVHHMGESSLVAFILVKSHAVLSSSHRVFEIPIEVATIPGLAKDWICLPARGSVKLIITKSPLYWWSRHLHIPINWSPLNICNHQYPGLNAGEELPTKVTVAKSQTDYIIKHRLDWRWYKLEIVSITSLAISYPGYFHTIYHYSGAENYLGGNHHDYP